MGDRGLAAPGQLHDLSELSATDVLEGSRGWGGRHREKAARPKWPTFYCLPRGFPWDLTPRKSLGPRLAHQTPEGVGEGRGQGAATGLDPGGLSAAFQTLELAQVPAVAGGSRAPVGEALDPEELQSCLVEGGRWGRGRSVGGLWG